MAAIATFASAIDADLSKPIGDSSRRSVQVIGVALEDQVSGGQRLAFVIVDHDGHGHLVPATELTFTDDSVMPPKYG
jgi:hypothetical protein